MKDVLRSRVAHALAPLVAVAPEGIALLLEQPKNPAHGDLAFPCFGVAKERRTSPVECAKEIASKVSPPEGITEVVAVGPFLNFRFARGAFSSAVVNRILSTRLSQSPPRTERILIEYSSPNIAKPFHVGHLRATLIGNCLDRVYRYLGYDVASVNHLGDWGTQFGFVWAGCKLWGRPETPSVDSLVLIYKRATALKEAQERGESQDLDDVNQLARDFFLDLEQGKPYATEFWSWCREISLQYLKQAYGRLGITFDHYLGESFYSDKLDAIRKQLEKQKLLKESQGALGIQLSEELGFARIATPDGRSLYLTRDIAAAKYRAEKFHFDQSLYIVGTPQTLHFQQLQAILRLMGEPYADRIVHVPFGQVLGMKTRGAGEIVELNQLLDEAVERALLAYREQVTKRPAGLDEDKTASAVSVAAIVFSELSRQRTKDVQFSWEHALAFSGDTGPYVLYANARINGIREKANAAGITAPSEIASDHVNDEECFALASILDDFDATVTRVIREHEPAVLAQYVLDVAKALSKAYTELKVIGAQRPTAEARFALLEATHITLERSLELLGIHPLERM